MTKNEQEGEIKMVSPRTPPSCSLSVKSQTKRKCECISSYSFIYIILFFYFELNKGFGVWV